MSADTAFVIYCDHEDCHRSTFSTASTFAAARREANDEGWECSGATDLCPGHNETGGPF